MYRDRRRRPIKGQPSRSNFSLPSAIATVSIRHHTSPKDDNDSDNGSGMNDYLSKNITFWAPKFKDLRKWQRWDWIFSCAALFQFLGFAAPEVLPLRMWSAASGALFVVAHAGRKFFVGWFWALSYCIVNIIAIIVLMRKRYKKFQFSMTELQIFDQHFMPFGISPYEFKELLSIAHKDRIMPNVTLCAEGLLLDKLHLITDGECFVIQNNSVIATIKAGSLSQESADGFCHFIGEVSFFDPYHRASATVRTTVDSEIYWWHKNELLEFLDVHKKIDRLKFLNILSGSMQKKFLKTDEKLYHLKRHCLKSMLIMADISIDKDDDDDDDNRNRIVKGNDFDGIDDDDINYRLNTLTDEKKGVLKKYMRDNAITDKELMDVMEIVRRETWTD